MPDLDNARNLAGKTLLLFVAATLRLLNLRLKLKRINMVNSQAFRSSEARSSGPQIRYGSNKRTPDAVSRANAAETAFAVGEFLLFSRSQVPCASVSRVRPAIPAPAGANTSTSRVAAK
ncbi:hypothetical protein DAEQUDRAFT_766545 [Daedalea quercina L-15889]|uniref:Uncharacterized protein n=1 Tax=Daedalea quercina L-15889 TaxID=1314783 RepID=A0A165PFQ0_9APHY|nr:hypothetical protein DAEQUDRAFT_766545 [Daedalea quercina L-15889]